jgi:hypothetical protein
MEITIIRIDTRDANGDGSDVITTYSIVENGKEFRVTCRSNRYGRSLGMEGKEGLLYVNSDDNTVHWQVVALGGGCGLLIDDEPVEGLSPWALRGVIVAERNNNAREITITTKQSRDSANQPLLIVDGGVEDFYRYLNASEDGVA